MQNESSVTEVDVVTGTWFNGLGLHLHTGRAVIIRVPNLVTANGAALT